MTNTRIILACLVMLFFLIVSVGLATIAAQTKYSDKNTLQVPGGLAISEFKGYEDWQFVRPSFTDAQHVIRVIVANPTMIAAYKAGVPGNGKPFPDGSKIAKIEWDPQSITTPPFSVATPDTVPGNLNALAFIEKDSKKFPDTHGWGYASFKYNPATDTLRPANASDQPPQANDAKCGAGCHSLAASKDYIFTDYPKR